MDRYKELNIPYGNAVCYSGYRKGQSPDANMHPSHDQVKEDLLILQKHWKYLRLYDVNEHSEMVLEIIHKYGLKFKVMLGAFIEAEMNNYGCPWGGIYPEKELVRNREKNLRRIDKLVDLASRYRDVVFSTSAGNEATVDWTDHFVPVKHVIEYVQTIRKGTSQPVTYCENYLPWHNRLESLAGEVDFISIHTYPVWEHKHIHEAMEYTKQNFFGVAKKYPGKPVMITEAGWATRSNGRGIHPDHVNEAYQQIYYNDLMQWCRDEGIITFVFEAFDEPWKGFDEETEPEKHWGLFYENRKPKLVMQHLFQ